MGEIFFAALPLYLSTAGFLYLLVLTKFCSLYVERRIKRFKKYIHRQSKHV